MGFKLTVILALAIFVAMYFVPGQEGAVKPPHVLERAEKLRLPEDETPVLPVTADATEDPVEVPAVAEEPPARDIQDQAVEAPLEASDSPAGLVSDPEPIPDLGLGSLGGSDAARALSLSDSVRARTTAETDAIDLSRPELSQLEVEETEDPLQIADPSRRSAEVVATSVNLRAGPSTGNPVVGRVGFGQRVVLVGEPANGWSAIEHPDTGDTVFTASRFLQILPE